MRSTASLWKGLRAEAAAIVAVIAIAASQTARIAADVVPVRYPEGIVHGFLALRSQDGKTLANGDLLQTSSGDRVTSRLVFHFTDGSIHDETAVYSQRRSFQLISDHLIQKGPTFPRSIDMTVSRGSGRVIVRYTDDGEEKVADERLELPPDLANGMTLTLLKNLTATQAPFKVSMVAATPKPRLVKLEIGRAGEDAFRVGGAPRKATHYVVKIEIGGLAGLVAPLVGKQPPDTHVWILGGDVPAFVKSEGPMFLGGPIWRIELVSPTWPAATSTADSRH